MNIAVDIRMLQAAIAQVTESLAAETNAALAELKAESIRTRQAKLSRLLEVADL